MSPRSILAPPTSAVWISPFSTCTMRTRTSSSTKAMYLESGDQTGSQAILDIPIPMRVGSSRPSWRAIMRPYPLPPLSENQAMRVPSGDQAGARSALPELRVRLRASPFSTGTVKISPRASRATLFPVGERETAATRLLTFSQRVSAQGKSPEMRMLSCRLSLVAGSRVCKYPSRSKTSAAPCPPSHFTSAPLKRVMGRRMPLAGV